MDLLEDSGDETSNNTKMDGEVDENMLLNSDDEEGGPKAQVSSQYVYDEEQLLYEGDEDEEYVGDETGDGDELDLGLGEEDLETPDSAVGTISVSPVKVRAHEMAESSEVHQDTERMSSRDDGSVAAEGDEKQLDSPPASVSTAKSTVDSDDDDEESSQRSRFWSERKTEDMSKLSGPTEGIPIQTLGERNQRPNHMGDSRRGNRGVGAGRGMRFGQRGMPPHGMRHRPPSLLGDHPRPPLLRFPHGYGQMGNGNMQQLQGGFIDFSKPIRPAPKSPLKNVHPQQKPPENESKQNVPPQPTSTPQQHSHPHGNQPQGAPTGSHPQRNLAPVNPRLARPLRPQQTRMVRPRGPPGGNPFLAPSPVVMQGPGMGPRPMMNAQRPALRPPQFQPQWNQPRHHSPSIPVVIAGGPMMGGPMEVREQFNNFGGPPAAGLMGPPPRGGPQGHHPPPPHFLGGHPQNGFHIRQNFPPRFGGPEEMMHRMPGPPHSGAGNPPFMQNYHHMHEMHQHFPGPEMHRMPGPPMMQHQGPPHQQPPQRYGPPPVEQQQQNWPPQHGDGSHFQQHQQQQQQQQATQHQHKGKVNPFRVNHLEEQHSERSNPFYSDRRRHDPVYPEDDDYRDGSGDRDRYRDSRSDRDYFDRHRDSRSDYRDSDRYDSYESERSYERSSHTRPPLKRPSESSDDRGPDKRSMGSPEKRLVGRLGPPVSQQRHPEEVRRNEEAMKSTQEAKAAIGLDDDYLRKLEQQKEMRARILREKEERRKKQLSGQLTDTHDSSSGSPSKESANREVRTVRTSQVVTQRPDTTRTTAVVAADTTGGHTKKSIYINPKAFRGDLSALKGVAKTSNAATGSQSNAVVRASVRTQIGASTGTRATGSETGGVTTGQQKKRTILRIVRNKKGEIISKSKVIVLPKGSLGGTTTTTSTITTVQATK